MRAKILFLISCIAFGQFAIYYWRASIAEISRAPVSERVWVAAGIAATALGARDFRAILMVHELAPDLKGCGGKFRAIRAYYFVVECLGRMIPAVTNWDEAEMTTCARYVAVQIGQHLERNIACAAQIRGI